MKIRARLLMEGFGHNPMIVRFDGREKMSTLFDFRVEIECGDKAVDLNALLWGPGGIAIYDEVTIEPQFFHGIVTEAAYLYRRGERHRYVVRLRPDLQTLAYRVRSRIFQDMTAPEIIKLVCTDAGLSDDGFDWNIEDSYYPKRVYCSQWKESELSFCLRLLEEEGIYFWFDHDEAGLTMRLTDNKANQGPITGNDAVPFSPGDSVNHEAIYNVVLRTQLTHDAHNARDWDFMQPAGPLEAAAEPEDNLYVCEEYPAGFNDSGQGGRLADCRVQEKLQDRYVIRGQSNCRRMRPGRFVSFPDITPDAMIGGYLLIQATHSYVAAGHAEAGGGTDRRYQCVFQGIPADTQFRAPRVTPRPRVHGVESAVVTGPAGEEIHVDEFGRIKVHFYWDREGAIDDTASCWIRVQQHNNSGSMILPRIGWEVDVGFLEGDPDRPIVFQKIYNDETMPPYALPANKTQSSMQSSTSPGGGTTNEVRLQDSNGGMQFFIHASRDLKLIAGHDKTEEIAVDSEETVDETSTLQVQGNVCRTIGANQSVNVTLNSQYATKGTRTTDIGGNDDWGIGINWGFGCGGNRAETISGLMNVVSNKVNEEFLANTTRTVGAVQSLNAVGGLIETIGGSKSETVIGAKMSIVAKTVAENIGAAKSLTAGAAMWDAGTDIALSAKGAIAITAAAGITEKCGDAFTFNAKTVKVTAPGGIAMKGGSGKFTFKGSTCTVDASKFGGAGGPKLHLKGKIHYKP